MAVITLRNVKGSPLTNSEVDGNFSNINTQVDLVSDDVAGVIVSTGDLDNLATQNKSNLVAAINEAYSKSVDAANIDLSNVRITGGEITNTDWKGNIVPIQYGGTQANTATQARTNLGVQPGVHVQAYNVNLTAIANVAPTKDHIIVGNESNQWSSANIRVMVADAVANTSSNLGSMAYQDSQNINVGNVQANGKITAVIFQGDGGLLSNIASGGGGGGGSGLFNTSVSQGNGYLLTTTAGNAVVIPNTNPSDRYIIHSIHVTNIDGTANANVTGSFMGTGYEQNITFADNVPIPSNTALEMLKKPKILQPGNYIQMIASDANRLHATITLEKSSESEYFGSGVDVTVADTYMIAASTNANAVIESVLLSNDSAGGFDVMARVTWVNSANTIQGYYCYDLVIPTGSTVEILEKPKFLPSGGKVMVSANMPNRIEAIVSGKKQK